MRRSQCNYLVYVAVTRRIVLVFPAYSSMSSRRDAPGAGGLTESDGGSARESNPPRTLSRPTPVLKTGAGSQPTGASGVSFTIPFAASGNEGPRAIPDGLPDGAVSSAVRGNR